MRRIDRFVRLFVLATAMPIATLRLAAAEQSSEEIEALRRDLRTLQESYEARIAELESRITALESSAPPAAQEPSAAVPAGAAGAGGPSGELPVYGGASTLSKVFNPDIAVIGDFLGAAGHNSVNPSPALEMHESEASFQAILDPYARADFFMAFGEEGVDLEEGYITFPAVPGGLLLKAGKMRSAFGKVNPMHNHVLSWTDRPLVTENLVGGEEGISDAGFSVARLIPNPWVFLEVAGQVYRGDSPGVFQSYERGDLSYVAHLRGYHDVTEASNLDMGFSYAHGHNEAGPEFTTDLYGTDFTFRYRPLRRAIYRSFIARSELDLEPARSTRRPSGCLRLLRVR